MQCDAEESGVPCVYECDAEESVPYVYGCDAEDNVPYVYGRDEKSSPRRECA